jgi:hypothetical protein
VLAGPREGLGGGRRPGRVTTFRRPGTDTRLASRSGRASSRILGTAAAAVLGLPATDFDPGKPTANCLVVVYHLTKTDPDAVTALRERAPGQVLFERVTCWTDPPRVTADVSGLLAQTVVPPWAAQMRRFEDGTVGQGPADDRPAEAVAAKIAHTVPEPDEGDGGTPPDVADHPEVEQYCLRPLASELLSSAIQEELTQSLPDDDRSPAVG